MTAIVPAGEEHLDGWAMLRHLLWDDEPARVHRAEAEEQLADPQRYCILSRWKMAKSSALRKARFAMTTSTGATHPRWSFWKAFASRPMRGGGVLPERWSRR